MRIVEVTENKKQYLDLLLLADEQEDMVDRYLYKGKMYVLDDDGVKCECVVTDEGNGILEIKNIATVPTFQRKGYAKALIEYSGAGVVDTEPSLGTHFFQDLLEGQIYPLAIDSKKDFCKTKYTSDIILPKNLGLKEVSTYKNKIEKSIKEKNLALLLDTEILI